MRRILALTITAAAGLLAGCTLAPDYHRPAAPVPAQLPHVEAATAAPAGAAQPGWRAFFTDEKLQQIIDLGLASNRDLRLAALNAERARAIYGIQRAQLLPIVEGVASGSKQGIPADLANGGTRTTSERYDVNLGVAAWELDLFGRIRSLKASALEQYLATEEAQRGARVALISSIAGAYLALAADRENLDLARTTLKAMQDSYALVKRRQELGLVPVIDLRRAQQPVEAARVSVSRQEQAVALDRNALDLLAGATVPEALLPAGLTALAATAEVKAGLSSDALLLRPDVLAAERQLRASFADIGVARAALFPRISLTASFGTASRELSDLFGGGQDAWTFAPRATAPIFDPRAWSALKASKVQGRVALTEYERAIQAAFRDVADALAVRAHVGDQVAAQEALVAAAEDTLRLASARYDQGLDSYLGVLDAQRSLFAAQQGLVSLRLARTANAVRLYAALGGGAAEAPAPAKAAPAAPGRAQPAP